MSAAELVSVCGLCGCLHPVNGPCPVPPPGGGTEAAPVVCDMASLEQHHRDTVLTEAGRALVRDAGEPVCSECGKAVQSLYGGPCRRCYDPRNGHGIRDAGAAPSGPLGTVAHWYTVAQQYHEQRDEALRRVERERAERWIAERERVGAERERDEARAECERLRGLIERDRTGLAAGLDAVRKRLASSFWLANEGEWGSYEYHERTERAWRGEVRQLLEDADSPALAALRASGDRVTEAFHGPAGPGERESLRASLDAANAEVARLRGERERKED